MRCAYVIGQALQRGCRGESIRVEQDQPCGLNFYSRGAAAPCELGVIDMGGLRRRRKGGHGLLKLLDQKLDTSGLGGKTCERTRAAPVALRQWHDAEWAKDDGGRTMLSILGDSMPMPWAF
ncbi:hypothetical protein LJR175_007420 [Variovorax sp. LjRoot175]|uniref:hypothetical protein n=1 Tax=Variovorax sp. LjRoot175 TaxID=3342276 RepID=UPI003ECD84CA